MILNFNSDAEWRQWRSMGIGASDAAAILGVSPWLTAYQLWEEKCNLVKRDHSNYATQRGNQYEPAARASFELLTGFDMPPAYIEHPTMSHIRASLDGYDAQAFLEIKCPGADDHEMAKAGKVPEKYVPQIQHQFLASGLKRGYYFSYDIKSETGTIVDVYPDRDYIEELVVKENKFWAMVTAKIPPALSDRDQIEITDAEIRSAAFTYELLSNKIKVLEQDREMLRLALIDKAKHPKVKIGNVNITRVVKRGSIDYSQITGIDFEKYRKADTVYYNVSIAKADKK